MDDQFGLQKAESPIPKLTDDTRQRLEQADEARQADPQVNLVIDTLTKLTELLDDWSSVWISPPWRSEASIAADRSERPGRVRVQGNGCVVLGEGARTICQPVATDQLEVFAILDQVTKEPWLYSEFTNVHKKGRPYCALSKFAPERFEYFCPTHDGWGHSIKFLLQQMKAPTNGTTSNNRPV